MAKGSSPSHEYRRIDKSLLSRIDIDDDLEELNDLSEEYYYDDRRKVARGADESEGSTQRKKQAKARESYDRRDRQAL